MTFVKGKSGNPSGRLRRGLSISDHIKELLDRDYTEIKAIHEFLESKGEANLGRVTVSRLVACRMIMFALSGSSEFCKELMNRSEGKVAEKLEVESRSVSLQFNLSPKAPRELPEAQRVATPQLGPQ